MPLSDRNKGFYGWLVVSIGFFFAFNLPAQTIQFRNATKTWGVPGNQKRVSATDSSLASCYGHGVSMADLNLDGRPDIYIANAVRYANKLPETFYVSVPGGYQENDKARGMEDSYGWTGSHGISFFDYDNDGDYDLFNSTTDDRNRLYRNKGDGYFEDVTDLAALPLIRITMNDFDPNHAYGYGTRGVVAFDANNDGWIDLYGANWGPAEKRYPAEGKPYGDPIVTPPQPNEFYLNLGNGRFQRIENSGATPVNPSHLGTQGVTAFDADEDGNMDLFVAHRNYVAIDPVTRQEVNGPTGRAVYNELFFGNGRGGFIEAAGDAGFNDDYSNDCNGVTVGDFDNDGDYDVFVVPKDKKFKFARFYQNDGRGGFKHIVLQTPIEQFGFSLIPIDADNDGDLDLIAPRTRDYTLFYRNDGNLKFTRIENTGISLKSFDPRGAAVGDVNNDGLSDIYYADANKDLIITSPSYPDTIGNHLFINKTATTNRWLKITGRGPKGDAGGIGTKIWVYDRGFLDDPAHLVAYKQVITNYAYLCQDDPVQHFGLGQRDSVDVKVRFLDKSELRMLRVPANQRIRFSKPAQLAGAGGNNQTGLSGVPLAAPLRVRVLDAYNQPVYGAPVQFNALQGGTFLQSQPVYTDASGYTQIQYIPASGVSQQTIRATCPVVAQVAYDFTCTASAPAYAIDIVSGNGQSGHINETLPFPLVILVKDQWSNPAGQMAVRFKVTSGNGKVAEADSVTVTTGPTGQASIFWRLGGTYGASQSVRVFLVNDRNTCKEFTATTYGAPAALRWLSAVTFSGTAGKALPDSLAGRIVDAQERAVRNHPVRVTVTAGGGSVNGMNTLVVTSNRDGYVKIRWVLGPQSGSYNNRLLVDAGVIQGSPLQISATGKAGAPARLMAISGENQSARRGQPLPDAVIVALTDSLQNPVRNALLSASRIDPAGLEDALTPAVTDSSGRATFSWSLSETVGVYRFIVRHGAIDPLEIRAQATAAAAADIEIAAGDGQHGLVGGRLAIPLQVRVLDDRMMPLAAVPVLFRDVNAMGVFPEGATAITDSNGIAACLFQFGSQPGLYEVEARTNGVDKSLLFYLTAASRPNQAPVIVCLADTTVLERQLLTFSVEVSDADGDRVQVWMEALPAGASYAMAAGLFTWQPDYHQAGTYTVTVCADDGLAAVQKRSVVIRVLDINQPPALLSWSPADSVIWTDVYQPYLFSVSAHDGDGDVLRYVWTLDGVYIGTDSTVSLYPNPAWTMHMVLKVTVYDAEFAVSHTWQIFRHTDIETFQSEVQHYTLLQNYPNPFNPRTSIGFTLPETAPVRIWICNLSGQTVCVLADRVMTSGRHTLSWDGRDGQGELVPSGLYYYGMESGDFRKVRKLLFVK